MAVLDLQIFIQERLLAFNENIDLTSGSPADVQVVQPILRRLGTDPYTIDLGTFLQDRVRQAFPDLAVDEGDALTDLLIKPSVLLWDPIVREQFRIRNSLSFRDPTVLTTDEAEALGANLFSERERGEFARGTGRLMFAQPRTVTLTPANFFSSRTGLHFFPDGIQSITSQEMQLNLLGTLYYFDVDLIAERAGGAYNLAPGQLVSVANIEGVARVTNPRRFRSGDDEETSVEFVQRAQQELTERSMVTLRGIGARVTRSFPEVSRLAVVGFGDPEMQRDVIQGGGLGGIVAAGVLGQTVLDGDGQPHSRRFQVLDSGIDFFALLSAAGGEVITIHNNFSEPPLVRDLRVRRVLSSNTLEVDEQVNVPFTSGRSWSIRRRELTLSKIPGGILFPDSSEGVVTVPDDHIHIGGMFDVYVRGNDLDESTLIIDSVSDSIPAAQGTDLQIPATGSVVLGDLVLDTNYTVNDDVHTAIASAVQFGFVVQILNGPAAGNYRVIGAAQISGASPVLTLDSSIAPVVGSFRWRLVDSLQIDLVEPKEIRVFGDDLETVQNINVVTTIAGVDFNALGVSAGDVLRIVDGADAGDFSVVSLPAFNKVQVDRPLTTTSVNISYTIFRPNAAGGIARPLARVVKVELLDTSGQPVGSVIPYSRPVHVQSRAFQNTSRGVKVDVRDATLGIVSQPQPSGGFVVGNKNLFITFASGVTGLPEVSVLFSSGLKTAQQVVDAINAEASTLLGSGTVLAVLVGTNRVGIVPLDPYTVVSAGTAIFDLFGTTSEARTSADIRSNGVLAAGGWAAVAPAINPDDLDVVQVINGNQIGFYGHLHLGYPGGGFYTGLFVGEPPNTFLAPPPDLNKLATFAPEAGKHVQVGARSIGSVRAFFLDPTSIEFNRDSVFSVELDSGAVLRYFPDPTLSATRIPAPPTLVRPKDGESTALTGSFTSASQDFVQSSIVPGDRLEILFVPISGSTLPDPVPGLALKSLVVSIDGAPDQTVIFVNDLSGAPNDVSRDGVADQLNNAIGQGLASINLVSAVELEGDVSIVVRATGSANTILGFSTTSDTDNDAPHKGSYTVVDVQPSQLEVTPDFPAAAPALQIRQSFEVTRLGTQRLGTTQMSGQVGTAGLYYMDVELVSEGSGDVYNLAAGLPMSVDVFRSDGYFLTSDDTNLSFSPVEGIKLHMSRSILEAGVSDDLRNATILTGQNIEVTYERAPLVGDVQNFASSDTERVVCANPLARHLIPHFVRFDLEYVGGSREDVVSRDVDSYIRSVFPQERLESSALVGLVARRGATSVRSPIDLVAVVYGEDRRITAQISQDGLNTGRLAAFVPDRIVINRRSS